MIKIYKKFFIIFLFLTVISFGALILPQKASACGGSWASQEVYYWNGSSWLDQGPTGSVTCAANEEIGATGWSQNGYWGYWSFACSYSSSCAPACVYYAGWDCGRNSCNDGNGQYNCDGSC